MKGRRFTVLETLGRGAFGTVYRAELREKSGFTQQVALKLMHYQGDAEEDIGRRLRDEARILGLIRHRAIVGVHSLVHLEAGWAVVMQYIEGADLTAVIASNVPPLIVSLEIVEDVCSALHTAYYTEDKGQLLKLVHRDIKPSNIRITAQGEVKLLDFGVARAEFARREAVDAQGIVFGSAKYMAPERRAGREGTASDMYSLGVVLANLLTGRRFPNPPRQRADHDIWVGKILSKVKTLLTDIDVPAERAALGRIEFLLLELLAWDPTDRPNARDVEQQLRKIRATLPGTGIKAWAELAIPRAMDRARERDHNHSDDPDVGSELIELTLPSQMEGAQETPPDQGHLQFQDSTGTPQTSTTSEPEPRAARPAEDQPSTPAPSLGFPAKLAFAAQESSTQSPPDAPVPAAKPTLSPRARTPPRRPPPAPPTAGLPPWAPLAAGAALSLAGLAGLVVLGLGAMSLLGGPDCAGPEVLNGEDDDCDGFVDVEGPWRGKAGLSLVGEDHGAEYSYTPRCNVSFDVTSSSPGSQTSSVVGSVVCPFDDPIAIDTFDETISGEFQGSINGTDGEGVVTWNLGAQGKAKGSWTMSGEPDYLQLKVNARTRQFSLIGGTSIERGGS